jgi:translation initiation factor IF-1
VSRLLKKNENLVIEMPKKKNASNRKGPRFVSRRLEEISKDFNRDEHEVYGYVTKSVGNRRFSVLVQGLDNPDEVEPLICSMKGSFRRRISPETYVLVKLFDFSTVKQGQIIDNYSPDEVDALKAADMWDYPTFKTQQVAEPWSDAPGMPEADSSTDTDSDSDSDSSSGTLEALADSEGRQATRVGSGADNDEFDIDAI